MQVVQQRMRPQKRPYAAHTGQQHEVVLIGSSPLGEHCGKFSLLKGTGQSLTKGFVPFLLLNLDRFVEEVAAFQVVQNEVKQVNMLYAQPRSLLGNVIEQEANVFPQPQFVFGRVIEDVESNLVADTAPAEEVVRDDPRQYLVQTFG